MRDSVLRGVLLESCRELERRGLVARTWGNMSVRVDDGRFLITPSGIPYEDLSEDSMVEVAVDDLGWSGPLKPSSEKGLHAMIYREKPDVRAVVHTHQTWASAFAAARMPLLRSGKTAVPCAAYALPTTKALVRAVREAITASGADSAILANHGALFFAESMEKAVALASALEDEAKDAILKRHAETTGGDASIESLLDGFVRARGRAGS